MRHLLLLPILLFALTACLDDDKYTTSPTDTLVFSADTIAFDTVFSGTPSSMLTLTVRNPHDKAIRIGSVTLQRGAESPFRINVDGMPLAGGSGTDFEIAAKDTMLVYAFVNPVDDGAVAPVPEEDELTFRTEGGAEQKVVLTASGQSVIPLQAKAVEADETLGGGRPYLVRDSLVVKPGATLTISSGTCLYFHAGASLVVHGTLVVDGTLEAPVVMRGDRLDEMFSGQPYDRIPGQWGGVVIASDSRGSRVDYADIHGGSFGIRVDSTDLDHSALLLRNSVVHTVQQHGLDARMARVEAGNCQLTNAGADCVHLRGGAYRFVHCTIGRFYVFTGGAGVALDMANYEGRVRLPLEQADFENCIVTGYQQDELMGGQNPDHQRDAFNYSFRNCLINTPAPSEPDGHWTACQWDDAKGEEAVSRDKNFTPDFDLDRLLFSFELSPKSRAVGTADPTITSATYPLDRLGRPRLTDGTKPDAGCYQHEGLSDK